MAKSKLSQKILMIFLIGLNTTIIDWAANISSDDANLFASVISDKVGQCRWSVKVAAN